VPPNVGLKDYNSLHDVQQEFEASAARPKAKCLLPVIFHPKPFSFCRATEHGRAAQSPYL